ncbi:T9SS type A sorting domain-containing protein [Maribacter sp. 2-571]|uniref:T9SS type A sorting domain-containing protein n=1 Tax=Maribacter sp. 2-571 TaxID=3417569 RepID=UPI003D3334B0
MRLLYTALLLALSFGAFAQQPASAKDLQPEEIPGFKIYPNPVFDDVVYITTAKNEPKEIMIFDVFGDVALRDVIKNKTLNISDLASGVYVLQVVEAQHSSTRKLVVK